MVAEFAIVCKESEIEEGQILRVEVDGEAVILAKKEGTIYALEGYCSHDGGEFEAGEKLCEGQLECPRHGGRFDIESGRATRMPAIAPISTYDVIIKNGEVFVAIED